MITIKLGKQGHYFDFIIKNKEITCILVKNRRTYVLPYQPKNLFLVKQKIMNSRNELPDWMINLFTITHEEQEEYDNAKDENALKEIILKDAMRNQCQVIDMRID